MNNAPSPKPQSSPEARIYGNILIGAAVAMLLAPGALILQLPYLNAVVDPSLHDSTPRSQSAVALAAIIAGARQVVAALGTRRGNSTAQICSIIIAAVVALACAAAAVRNASGATEYTLAFQAPDTRTIIVHVVSVLVHGAIAVALFRARATRS